MAQARVTFDVADPEAVTVRRGFAAIRRIDRGLREECERVFRNEPAFRQCAMIDQHAHVFRHVGWCRRDTSGGDVDFEPLSFGEWTTNRERLSFAERLVT